MPCSDELLWSDIRRIERGSFRLKSFCFTKDRVFDFYFVSVDFFLQSPPSHLSIFYVDTSLYQNSCGAYQELQPISNRCSSADSISTQIHLFNF